MAGLKCYLVPKHLAQATRPLVFHVGSTRMAVTLAEMKTIDDLPGPSRLPFIGSLWLYFPIIGKYDMMHLDLAAEDYYKTYGSMVQEKIGSLRLLHLFEPEHFELVAKATMNNPIRMGFLAVGHYRDSNPDKYNSPGILPVNDERWWKLRQAFQRSVSPLKEARDFLEPTDEITKEFVDGLESGGTIEDLMPLANRLNMELVCKLLFNERVHCFNKAALAPDSFWTHFVQEVVEFAEGIGEQDRNHLIWKFFRGKGYKKMVKTMETMEDFSLKMLEKVKAKGDGEADKCIISQFLRDPDIPPKEILAATIDLLLGGIHTTAITTCFLLYHIDKNSEVEKKLKEEARRLVPPGGKITAKVLNEAVYTRAVVKEIFRVNPIGTAQGRTLPEDLVINGYNIPKDTLVILQSLASCRQERFFKDAHKFKPERWVKGSPEFQPVHPYLSMPFGLGLRSCLARRRAEQNLLVLTLRVYSRGEFRWLRDDPLTFTTPFMISPEGQVKFKFNREL